MPSPYPWHYTLRFFYYFCRPSTRNRTGLARRPLAHTFLPGAGDDVVRVFFVGDIMVMQGERIPQIDPAFAELLRGADLVVGNCESPVAHKECRPEARYRFVFDMAEEYLRTILDQAGLPHERWALSVANNHAGDQGVSGLAATKSYFQRLGVTTLGAWQAGAPPVVTVTRGDLRIGVAAWTNWLNADVFRNRPGVWRTAHVAATQWRPLREALGLDALLGFPHWEFEFQHFPTGATRRLAGALMDDGFDLIVGVHPHTLQPMEWLAEGACLYSIGNFCGLGIAWPVRLAPVLEVRLAAAPPHRGRVAGYVLHTFAQVNEKDRIRIVPLHRAPSPLRERLSRRLELVFDVGPPR